MPLAISRTPFRVSFFGGGTDYPAWYLKHGGAVLSTAIDKYCYVSCRHLPPFFPVRHRIVWSYIETVNSISEILHPAVRGGMRYLGFDDSFGIEMLHQGDLPARSGIGSSSAFSVGLINALSALRNITPSQHELASMALDLEQNHLKENVGSQDQVACAYGGLNLIRFEKNGSFAVDSVNLAEEGLAAFEQHLMMFYTGTHRLSGDFSKLWTEDLESKEKRLGTMQEMVFEALDLLCGGRLNDFGRMLHETWLLKRAISGSVSTPAIDEIYEAGIAAGALGGKLLGAGGAGFMLFFVPPAAQDRVRAALSRLLYVPVRCDMTGSTLIYRRED